MRPLELAEKYMEIVFAGKDLDGLRSLFSDRFSFQGPLYAFNSGEAYIQSLKDDPPQGFEYALLGQYENDSSACLLYQFSKPGVTVPMAQQFEITDGRISSIRLSFDASVFT